MEEIFCPAKEIYCNLNQAKLKSMEPNYKIFRFNRDSILNCRELQNISNKKQIGHILTNTPKQNKTSITFNYIYDLLRYKEHCKTCSI